MICGFSYIGTHDKNTIQNEGYPFQNKDSILLTSFKNDMVYAKIAIEAITEDELSITHTSFKSNQDIIKDISIEYGLLEEANASLGIGYDPSIPHIQVPEIITDQKEFSILPNQIKYIWILRNNCNMVPNRCFIKLLNINTIYCNKSFIILIHFT